MRQFLFFFFFFAICAAGKAQYSTTISKESLLILPPDYQPNKKYPILVLMPYTNGSALDYFNKYLSEAKVRNEALTYSEQWRLFLEVYNLQYLANESFAVVIPDGTGSRNDHSWAGFSACIERYEKRVMRDVRKFSRMYSGLDTNQVYLSGVSLGGDLSWALSVRNPHFFKGAMVVGSRCSFPPNGNLPVLSERGFKYFLVMGMNEGQDRLVGMRYARHLLDSAWVQYSYREMPFLEHDRAPLWLFMEGLHWLMNKDESAANTESQPDIVPWYDDVYAAHIEVCKWELAKDDDLSSRGDGLLVCTQTQQKSHQSVAIRQQSGYLWIEMEGLPPLKARFIADPDNYTVFYIELLEQESGGYKYQGRATDIDHPKRHGFWDTTANIWGLDLEFFSLKDHNRRTSYNILIEL